MSIPWIVYSGIFTVAVLYASVGLGGATGYLAVFGLFGMTDPLLAPTVLVLNVFVAALSFFSYYREGHFHVKLLLPFIVTSLPTAFLGGMIPVGERLFSFILGVVLLGAGVQLLFSSDPTSQRRKSPGLWQALPVGILLGLVAGLTGSGGGFLLIPLLIVFFGTDPREAAAVAGAFVFLNSVTGFAGHFARDHYTFSGILPLILTVGIGGIIGSQLGARILNPKIVQHLVCVVLFFSGLKLLLHPIL